MFQKIKKLDAVEIGKELIRCCEKHFPKMMGGVEEEEELKRKDITHFEFSKEIE